MCFTTSHLDHQRVAEYVGTGKLVLVSHAYFVLMMEGISVVALVFKLLKNLKNQRFFLNNLHRHLMDNS